MYSKKKFIIKLKTNFAIIACLVFLISAIASCNSNNTNANWVATWSTAPQLVEPHNNPPAPGLTNNTLRQIVRVSIGSNCLRLKMSNEFSKSAITLNKVTIAASTGQSKIDTNTISQLMFNGKNQVTIEPGTAIVSDEVAFNLLPRMDLAITINFGQTPDDITGHPGSRTTSYLIEGDNVMAANLDSSVYTDHWYVINGIDVKAAHQAAAVAIIGNSITDGRGSGTNKQNRWPDILSERLLANEATKNIGVLNLGIGGNCVLKPCLGPSAINRYKRDVLDQKGVKWVIVLEGVNDLGQTPDSLTAINIANGLIDAYKTMVDSAHARGLKIYGATILPFTKSFYYQSYREHARNIVNKWIRESGEFDAVIDFDLALRNPGDTNVLIDEAHTGDYLHPNELGYQMMGEYIDLSLFE